MSCETIVHRLVKKSQNMPSAAALVHKAAGRWETVTWQGYAALVRSCGRAFMALGLEPGQVVTILSDNNVPWVVADLAAMAVGGVATGIYQSCTPEQIAYIVEHSEAPICLVQNEKQLAKLVEIREGLPKLKWGILLEGDVPEEHKDWVMTWDALLEHAGKTPEAEYDARFDALESDALATLIYTSGTTGNPKGVMLSHHNLTFTADAILEIIPPIEEKVGLSYLPLSHIAEQLLTIHLAITWGITVWFAESMDKLKENLPEARPTYFFGVPRVWEKFEAALKGRLEEATGVKAALLAFARKTASEVNTVRQQDREPRGLLGLEYALADKLVLGKLKSLLGLERCQMYISGAAPISRSTLEFFQSLDVNIWEVYGQSEDTGPTTFNRTPGAWRLGTVGKRIPGIDVEIASDGEILVKGGNVFQGYYKSPEHTAETLVNGWLHSGDVGEFDSEGFLRITDRKKDLLITAGGKNVAPQNIENLLKAIPEVSQAVVIGDRRKYLSALLTLEEAATMRWAGAHGLQGMNFEEVLRERSLLDYLQQQVDEVNSGMASFETIKKYTVLAKDFTPETGELTPTMKVKRKVVGQKYADQIERMYSA